MDQCEVLRRVAHCVAVLRAIRLTGARWRYWPPRFLFFEVMIQAVGPVCVEKWC